MKHSKRLPFIFCFFSCLILSSFLLQPKAVAQTTDPATLANQIAEYEKELVRLASQTDTLNNQIAQFNAQINLAILRITQTEEKVNLLGTRIKTLEVSLDALNKSFYSRAVETYKMAKYGDPVLVILTSPNISEGFSRFYYLKKIQEADRSLLGRLTGAQNTYKDEKSVQETLQLELNKQKLKLTGQKAAKAKLLETTKNDEKRYQVMLAQARAEYEAIQGIISGRGVETVVGHVSEGVRIASLITGASCNSEGTHLHFWVAQNGTTQNPFNYLKSGVAYENCSGSYCGSPDGDPFNPSGTWNWPIMPKIEFNQGYGATWAVRNTWVARIYKFHNGIDIESESAGTVSAVKSGTLYRGSYKGSCTLRYVRLKHDDGGFDTYYLHVNY